VLYNFFLWIYVVKKQFITGMLRALMIFVVLLVVESVKRSSEQVVSKCETLWNLVECHFCSFFRHV
jgi:hypothetical protein